MRVFAVALLVLALVASSMAIGLCFRENQDCTGDMVCTDCDPTDSCCSTTQRGATLYVTVDESGVGSNTMYTFNVCNDMCGTCNPVCTGPVGTCCESGLGTSYEIRETSTGTGIWAGSYSVDGGCDTSSCCCLAEPLTVTQSGTSVVINSGLRGNCGGQTSASIPVTLSSATSTTASFTFGGESYTAQKDGNTVTVTNNDASQCSGSATCVSGPCREESGGSGSCFHMDTIITYAGKEHKFEEIRSRPECNIPHVVSAYGVIVSAKCGNAEKTLKLTGGHLVYTQRGLQAASDLKPGQDTLYSDLAETAPCQVLNVTKETQPHDYFGLNCLNSQVLASGIKSSTFEKLHSVPAFWMQVMGRVLGIKRASQLGDYLAELVQQMNLI